MPKVSVIMPCFNHSEFLPASINGVLGQTYADLELIIIDDCSSDSSWKLAQRLVRTDARVRAVRNASHRGVSHSRNIGLQLATGEFVGFCDADDIWESDKLAFQLNLLLTHPSHQLTYCDAVIIDENSAMTGKRFSDLFPSPGTCNGELFHELVGRNFINTQTVLMRNECLQRVSQFDEDLKVVEDWWYWIQLSRHCRFLYSEQPLARYRMHSRSTSLLHQRTYCVSRFKVVRRILKQWSDLSLSTKADLVFRMGVDLCELRKYHAGRRLLWEAIGLSIQDVRALGSCCRALRRLILYAISPSTPARVS